MKAKNKVIIKSYGEYWDLFSETTKDKILKNNGSVDYFLLSGTEIDETEKIKDLRRLECTGTDEGTKRYFRPKSLEGIEENNGWIRIDIKEDLPSKNIDCFCLKKDGSILIAESRGDHFWCSDKKRLYSWGEFTHYQPITYPKPPIY